MFLPPMRGLLQGPPASRPLALGAHLSAPSLAGEKQSHRPLPLPLPACGERLESARSSRKFRVKGPRPEFELCREGPSSRPFLPASGEREQRRGERQCFAASPDASVL